MSWALERLARHPAILAKTVQAAQSSAAGDPSGDEYLDAVVKETLRVRTVVFDVGRVLEKPVELAGYRLPAGIMVVPGMVRVHADGELYPEPERFDPDRMLGATLSPTTWFPFGGGNRRCLGATFAMVEMRVVLREILRRIELETRRRRTNGGGSSTSSSCRTAVRGFGCGRCGMSRRRGRRRHRGVRWPRPTSTGAGEASSAESSITARPRRLTAGRVHVD